MSEFQLPAVIALAASALCSLALHILSRPAEGKIRLPTFVVKDADGEPLKDPFDVTEPEDVVDGEPLDELAFWARMRLRKLIITSLLAIILAAQAFSLGWAIMDEDITKITDLSLHVVFALYIFALAARSVNREYSLHSFAILHMSGLTTVAAGLLGTLAIVPAGPIVVTSTIHSLSFSTSVPQILGHATAALYFVACIIAITTPRGPALHFPSERIYAENTLMQLSSRYDDNVCGITGASVWDLLLFSYTTKVVMLGNASESLEIADLPIVPGDMRATTVYANMRLAVRRWKLQIGRWSPQPGSGWALGYRVLRVNAGVVIMILCLTPVSAMLFYAPAFFLRRIVQYIESDTARSDRAWGWVYCVGLFSSNAINQLLSSQVWSLAATTLQVRIRAQLSSILFAKTLVMKDVASSSSSTPGAPAEGDASDSGTAVSNNGEEPKKKEEHGDEFSSKAQIMTLMTTDADRVSDFALQMFYFSDAPFEILIGTIFLYNMLGVSCFLGLAVTCLFIPINHFTGKIVIGAQDNLMKTRDKRVSLMNEILGGIRMIKFMAWERSFEARVLKVRERELKYQRLNFAVEILWNAITSGSPILVTLVSFWHFTVIRGQTLTPSIAFTSISVFSEMRFALNNMPGAFIGMLQSLVSLRRVEKYFHGAEVDTVPPLNNHPSPIVIQSATITWPSGHTQSTSTGPSLAPTPKTKFTLIDLTLDFPRGALSLICGKLGSGKTLLLLSLLGEADVLAGQLICPRSPPDTIASFIGVHVSEEEWVVEGVCAYVPQSAWLRNASIRDNILFNLPYVEERYRRVLEVCALDSDLRILEDGDMSEIGERGVNLSGGQKARVSLARAVYSRASVLFLDDVLSAVDAHTAHHLFHQCLRGDLMRGRTIILVSHHVQLCAPEASYIVALDNGRVQYQGGPEAFQNSDVLKSLSQSNPMDASDSKAETQVPTVKEASDDTILIVTTEKELTTNSTAASPTASEVKPEKKTPRKLVEEEKRAVGHVSQDIWMTYVKACGGALYWTIFGVSLLLAAASPILESGWVKIWSGASLDDDHVRSPLFYLSIYASITVVGLILNTAQFIMLYRGGLHASRVLYQRLLETVLFANIRFHDTISRGTLLNRFGKDFEGVDSSLPDNFGRSTMHGLSAMASIITVSVVGGLPFILAIMLLGTLYYNVGKVYGQTSRDMRRLDSVTRSPLYSIYGETIAGVTVLRAFGASSKFLRDMLCCVDTNINPFYWMWGVNRWVAARFNLLSSAIVGITGFVAVMSPSISASMAGFALALASTITSELLSLVMRFVGLEQSMVAVERIKEFSEIKRESPEFIEPRPPTSWPTSGAIKCQDLVIRYAPDLPNVLHRINFEIKPGEKVGILGRTGSGKSTLALSFFRFVEPTQGRILVDDVDIASIGLTDLRSKLTTIPQDPTIMSGTLRSALDVFNEYEDANIYEALKRVHLLPSDGSAGDENTVNANVFRNLDSPVSEGGENFSTGEKQLLCMARAILKRSKILVMDEATASVDYATDELIGKTIRQEFADSTILTIAHRLRTIIDYDRVMLLDEGRIVEFDKPSVLLQDTTSKFYVLCKATGHNELSMLKKIAGV